MERSKNYLTLASVLAAFSVIVMHTNEVFWSFSTEHYWMTANIIDGVFYFAVPVFFMITGTTLLNYTERYNTAVFLKKRIVKTFIPFVVWSIIGVLYFIITNRIELNQLSLKFIIKSITDCYPISIFWFFQPLFGVYFAIPLFAAVNNKITAYTYVASVGLIINLLIPFVINVFKIDYSFPISVSVGSGYLFYIVVGWLIANTDIKIIYRIIIYIFSIMGLFIQIIGTYSASVKNSSIIKTYKGYNNIPAVLYSIGVFVFIKYLSERIKNKTIWRVIKFLGKFTFSTYLLQWFIMDYAKTHFSINVYSMWYRLGFPIIVYLTVIVVVGILRVIPVLKRIVP